MARIAGWAGWARIAGWAGWARIAGWAGLARIAGWAGLVGHALFFVWYGASGVVAPAWAVAVLLGAWAALLVPAIRLFRVRPAVVLALPVVDAVLWLALVSAGDAVLGWTA
jgi:hypothetical protein